MAPENVSNLSVDKHKSKRNKLIPKFEKQFSNCRKFCSSKATHCLWVSDYCCIGKTKDILKCDIVIKSVACNKLTHCLFDFDRIHRVATPRTHWQSGGSADQPLSANHAKASQFSTPA